MLAKLIVEIDLCEHATSIDRNEDRPDKCNMTAAAGLLDRAAQLLRGAGYVQIGDQLFVHSPYHEAGTGAVIRVLEFPELPRG